MNHFLCVVCIRALLIALISFEFGFACGLISFNVNVFSIHILHIAKVHVACYYTVTSAVLLRSQ